MWKSSFVCSIVTVDRLAYTPWLFVLTPGALPIASVHLRISP